MPKVALPYSSAQSLLGRIATVVTEWEAHGLDFTSANHRLHGRHAETDPALDLDPARPYFGEQPSCRATGIRALGAADEGA